MLLVMRPHCSEVRMLNGFKCSDTETGVNPKMREHAIQRIDSFRARNSMGSDVHVWYLRQSFGTMPVFDRGAA